MLPTRFVTNTSAIIVLLAASTIALTQTKKPKVKAKAKPASQQKATRRLTSPRTKGSMMISGPAYTVRSRPATSVQSYNNTPWLTHFRSGMNVSGGMPTHNYIQGDSQVYAIPAFPGGTVVSSSSGNRLGYHQYVQNFPDNLFYYQNYGYSPGSGYYSPWYYYGNLPPYIPSSGVTVLPNYTQASFSTDWVNYNTQNQNPAIEDVVNRLNATYRSGNPNWLTKLAYTSDQIAIFLGGNYQYSVSAADFAQMINDLILGTQTTGFSVDRVQVWGSRLRIVATHRFVDSEGSPRWVRQEYIFGENERGNASLIEFGTSR